MSSLTGNTSGYGSKAFCKLHFVELKPKCLVLSLNYLLSAMLSQCVYVGLWVIMTEGLTVG